MKAKLIESIVFDEQNIAHKTYGVQVMGKDYHDISLDKDLILKFVEFLNNDEAPDAEIEVIIEDLLS